MNSKQLAAIERLRELEKKATPGKWEFKEYPSSTTSEYVGIMTSPDIEDMLNGRDCDVALSCALRNEALPLIEALQQENERLRKGIGRALKKLDNGSHGDAEDILEALHDA